MNRRIWESAGVGAYLPIAVEAERLGLAVNIEVFLEIIILAE